MQPVLAVGFAEPAIHTVKGLTIMATASDEDLIVLSENPAEGDGAHLRYLQNGAVKVYE